MSEFFFKALDEDEGKTKDKNFFFDALDQDESISKPKDFFFDALDADTNLSAGSDAPPVSGSNQPSGSHWNIETIQSLRWKLKHAFEY